MLFYYACHTASNIAVNNGVVEHCGIRQVSHVGFMLVQARHKVNIIDLAHCSQE